MPDDNDADVSSWEMNPKGMMRYFNSVTYTLRHAIADLVDNCIDAGAKNILIDFDYNRTTDRDPYIVIADDGKGIKEDEFDSAMTLGKEESTDYTKLATYGVGMKLSSLTQAQEITIYSRPSDQNHVSIRRISKKHIDDVDRLELLKTPSDIGHVAAGSDPISLIENGNDLVFPGNEGMDAPKFTTVVTLESMHKLVLWGSIDKTPQQIYFEQKEFIRCHLGLIYHRIIEKRRDLTIKLCGSPIKPIDPFLPHENSEWHGTISVKDSANIQAQDDRGPCPIRVNMCVIPHQKQMKNGSYAKDVHKILKKSKMQGIYWYRNDRIIQYGGGWHGLADELDTRQLGRCSVEIPPEFYQYFGVSPYKLAVEPIPAVRQTLAQLFMIKRHWGKMYGDRSMGKKPFTGKKKDYLSNSGDKATSDAHGVAIQRYTSEGKKGSQPVKKWKDNEDPFAIVSMPVDDPDDEEEIVIEEIEDEEVESVPELHYEIQESTGVADTVVIKRTHPNYDEIFQLLTEEGGD